MDENRVVFESESDRPLPRELRCLTPEAFDRADRAPGAETGTAVARLRPVPEIRRVPVDRGGRELLPWNLAALPAPDSPEIPALAA